MKTLYALLPLSLLAGGMLNAQSITLDPWPVVADAPVRMYVDITSEECACPELQDADPETNPLYIWTYNPSEDRPELEGQNVDNGDWFASNPNLVMAQDDENPNLWYFDFLDAPLLTFYGVTQEVAETNGLAFLLKESNGAPEGLPEQKSADMGVGLEFAAPSSTTDFHESVAAYDVYPNPTTGAVQVRLALRDANYQDLVVRVVSIDGREVRSIASNNELSTGLNVELSNLASGLYMVQVLRGNVPLATQKLKVK